MDVERGGWEEQCMREALGLAREAAAVGEVPVGAVVENGGQIIGRGRNSAIGRHDPTAHAEILEEATLYCTLEPCVMCAGALVAARVKRLVFGARDLRFGGVRSKFQVADSEVLNHRVEVMEGLLGAECVELLQGFFEARR
jgi:tRNA(adenine34) deaminase